MYEDGPAKESYKEYAGEYPKEETRPDIGRMGSALPLGPQEKALAELHDMIGVLHTKLSSVLTPVPEKDRDTTAADKEKSQSPLAEQLDANNRGIQRASQSLRGIIERLEC